uniref:Uncharacterized protein n=1 Tax=Triticum urartu TaxID=4572 RepID=A0A8R7Q5Q1_TRIUA
MQENVISWLCESEIVLASNLYFSLLLSHQGVGNLKVMVYLAFQPEDRRSKPDRSFLDVNFNAGPWSQLARYIGLGLVFSHWGHLEHLM